MAGIKKHLHYLLCLSWIFAGGVGLSWLARWNSLSCQMGMAILRSRCALACAIVCRWRCEYPWHKLMFYQHGFTLIPPWIPNYIHYEVWNEITYPFPNFNGTTVEFWEWISNFIHNTSVKFETNKMHFCSRKCTWKFHLLIVGSRVQTALY